jgi:RimJ/RimL family protein N-acetyltransferase
MNYEIENKIIGLAKTATADLNLICEIENDQANSAFITPYTVERHLIVIESKDEEHLTVWNKATNRIIGFIILAGIENPNLSLEFRRIVIQSKGNGFGRQCLRLIKEYCFKRISFHRLWLDVFDDNDRAINLYKTEGFKIEGQLREVIKQDNKYRNLILLSILDREYRQE